MAKRFKVIPAGVFKDKKITIADSDRVDQLRDIASSFMSQVFDLLPGDYAISDESELRDFATFSTRDTALEWKAIEEVYGLTKNDVGTENLATIFEQIASRAKTQ